MRLTEQARTLAAAAGTVRPNQLRLLLHLVHVSSSNAGGHHYGAPRRIVSLRNQVMKRCNQLLGRLRGPSGICIVPDLDS